MQRVISSTVAFAATYWSFYNMYHDNWPQIRALNDIRHLFPRLLPNDTLVTYIWGMKVCRHSLAK